MSEQESTKTIIWALCVNATIVVLKLVVGLVTGSAAMLAEAAHSAADSSTEVLLLWGTRHARTWHKARYFWSLVAAVHMFALGGLYACYEGVTSLLGEDAGSELRWVGLVVLGVCAVLEASSWVKAYRTLAAERAGVPWVCYLRTTTNTPVKTIFYEDSADLVGVALATVGITLRLATGSALWEGLAAILIGLLLTVMAYELGSHNIRLLRQPAYA